MNASPQIAMTESLKPALGEGVAVTGDFDGVCEGVGELPALGVALGYWMGMLSVISSVVHCKRPRTPDKDLKKRKEAFKCKICTQGRLYVCVGTPARHDFGLNHVVLPL